MIRIKMLRIQGAIKRYKIIYSTKNSMYKILKLKIILEHASLLI